MATIGTLVGAQAQDTTTTTGTGAITLANAVPATAPPGSTTFGAQFAPLGFAGGPINNIFYAIIDTTGNIEVGLGTLTSSTNLTRDYVLGSYTGGALTLAAQTPDGTHVNFAAGTKQVYSNTTLFATSVAVWARIPDDNAANIFNATMSGTFTGILTTGATTANIICRYKISNEGIATVQLPAVTVNGAGTNLIITGVPSFLSSVAAGLNNVPALVQGGTGGQLLPGSVLVVPGATPTTVGQYTLSQLVGGVLTSTFTTAVVNGTQASVIVYPLY